MATVRKETLLYPIRNEHIGVALLRRVAVGAEDDLLAVGREHREAVEGVVERDALQPRAVDVDYIKVEVAPALVIDVRREDDPLAVGEEVRSEAGFVELCHAALVRPVGVHHPDVQLRRADQILFEQRQIVGLLFLGLGVISAEDYLFAVVAPERPAVVAEFVGQPLHVLTVLVHRVDVQVAVAQAGEDDRPVFTDRGLGVVAVGRRQRPDVRSVEVGDEDVEAGEERPDVAARVIGLGRAIGRSLKRRGVDDVFVVGSEEGAGGLALAVRQHLHIRPVDVHREYLVAAVGLGRALEDQLIAVRRKIGLGVLAFVGQLFDVGEMALARVGEDGVDLEFGGFDASLRWERICLFKNEGRSRTERTQDRQQNDLDSHSSLPKRLSFRITYTGAFSLTTTVGRRRSAVPTLVGTAERRRPTVAISFDAPTSVIPIYLCPPRDLFSSLRSALRLRRILLPSTLMHLTRICWPSFSSSRTSRTR